MPLSFASYTPRIDYDAEFGTGVASQWDDQSGNGHHATQATASKQMAMVAGANTINGLPARRAVWAPGTTGTAWDIPDAAFTGMTGAVGAEAFVVYMRDYDPGIQGNAGDGGVWQLGNGNGSWHPWPGNNTYHDNFFSSARKDNLFANTRRACIKPMIMNAWSMTNDWGVLVNGGTKWGMSYSVASNTFALPPAGNAKLGCSGTAGDGGVGAYAFTGYLWRFLLFARKLTPTERNDITNALATYYGAMQSYELGGTRDVWVPNGAQFVEMEDRPSSRASRTFIITSRPDATSVGFNGLTDYRSDKGETKDSRTTIAGVTITGGGGTTTNVTTYYKMRAIDPDCGSLTYRTWVVTGEPDTTGALYSGTRCGANPLTNITIVDSWQVST